MVVQIIYCNNNLLFYFITNISNYIHKNNDIKYNINDKEFIKLVLKANFMNMLM
jgi:hypothetical protein